MLVMCNKCFKQVKRWSAKNDHLHDNIVVRAWCHGELAKRTVDRHDFICGKVHYLTVFEKEKEQTK